MNTNDEKIQWHPAFDAALQIELGEETKYLEFDSEHLLSKKPMQIDVLVKNERHVKIQKNIGRIFRQYNVVEYKSPEDDLNIDDFYKVYAYACIYKADTETVDFIPAAELTITFVCYHYPRTMLQKLQRDRQITVENMESGIYYLMGDAIPMQLIIVPRLSKTNNYWLNNLRNDLKSGGEIRNFIEKYGENKNSKLYQALADTIMRANWQELKEERKMCEALRELFADDLRESREEGIMEGRNVGKLEGKLEGAASKVIENDHIINSALNYGYAIIRGMIARSIICYGLEPSIGIFHHSELNNYNLADDMIEPFRPLVDLYVSSHFDISEIDSTLTPEMKKGLFGIINFDMSVKGDMRIVSNCIDMLIASYSSALQGNRTELDLPELIQLQVHSYE